MDIVYGKRHLGKEKVISAKNHFSGAGTLMCVTQEWYGLSRSGLHHYVQRRAHFTMVSISRYVKIIASGRFSLVSSPDCHVLPMRKTVWPLLRISWLC